MRRLLTAALAATLVIAAPAGAATHKVTVGSNYYAPGKKTVKRGDKVRFVWEEGGFEVHDVGVESGPTKFKSPLQSGGTWTTKKLRKTGKYVLVCSQHADMTMTLKVKR